MKKFIIEQWNNVLTGVLAVIVFWGGAIKSFFLKFDGHEGSASIFAAIIGGIISGLITLWAVWWTAELDRKSTKDYMLFDKLWELREQIKTLRKHISFLSITAADKDNKNFYCEAFDKDLLLKINIIDIGILDLQRASNRLKIFYQKNEDEQYFDNLRESLDSLSNLITHLHMYFESIDNQDFVKLFFEEYPDFERCIQRNESLMIKNTGYQENSEIRKIYNGLDDFEENIINKGLNYKL